MDTLERILELQKQSGLTVKALEAATGISNGSFSKWKKGTYAPSAEAVLRLLNIFTFLLIICSVYPIHLTQK